VRVPAFPRIRGLRLLITRGFQWKLAAARTPAPDVTRRATCPYFPDHFNIGALMGFPTCRQSLPFAGATAKHVNWRSGGLQLVRLPAA
jgi:hypothetical protein